MALQPALLLQTPASHGVRLLRALPAINAPPCIQPPSLNTLADDALVHCIFPSLQARAEVDRQSEFIAGAIETLTTESTDKCIYRLMAFPRSEEEKLGDLIPLKVQLAMSGYTHLFCLARISASLVYYGTVPAAQHVLCTQPTFSPISRAYWKLEEAVARFAIPCINVRALDIGAAPGGWTQFLVRAGAARVVAIDPAPLLLPLSPALLHLPLRLQEALNDERLKADAPCDLLVADMNIHPQEAAQLMLLAAPLLRDGGHLVLTAKLVQGFSAAADRQEQLSGAEEILAKAFDSITQLWALSNGNERTIHARKRKVTSDVI